MLYMVSYCVRCMVCTHETVGDVARIVHCPLGFPHSVVLHESTIVLWSSQAVSEALVVSVSFFAMWNTPNTPRTPVHRTRRTCWTLCVLCMH